MHWEAFHFVALVKKYFPHFFLNADVLEIGSYKVNVSVRDLFFGCRYTGVDLVEGPGVDKVAVGHKVQLDDLVDIALSCECFEHNPYYEDTFENMVSNTKNGGLVVFTCASIGRPEHGTDRTTPHSSPGTSSVGWDYYKNLDVIDFSTKILKQSFLWYRFFTNPSSQDLYFIGQKTGVTFLESNEQEYLPIFVKDVEHFIKVSEEMQKLKEKEPAPHILRNEELKKSIIDYIHPFINQQLAHQLSVYFLQPGKKVPLKYLRFVKRTAESMCFHPHNFHLLARCYENLGQLSKAIDVCQGVVKNSIEVPAGIYIVLISCLEKEGRIEEAKQVCLRSLSEHDKPPNLFTVCASLFFRARDRESALSICSEGMSLFPNSEGLKKASLMIENSL